MNMQQAFVLAVRATLAQGCASYKPITGTVVGSCYYRHPRGSLKCAVGHLIPNKAWDPEMEGKPVLELAEHFPEALPFLSSDPLKREKQLDLLQLLQTAHDSAAVHPAESFKGRFLATLRQRLAQMNQPLAIEWLEEACNDLPDQ